MALNDSILETLVYQTVLQSQRDLVRQLDTLSASLVTQGLIRHE